MKFYVHTDHPIAVNSVDHLWPHGTARDDSRSEAFNDALASIVGPMHAKYGRDDRPGSILDIGCAGGGMICDFVDKGWDAVGIEGSDYNRIHQRAGWGDDRYKDHLFTADATEEFYVIPADREVVVRESVRAVVRKTDRSNIYASHMVHFDVITAWEFMEHIAIEDLKQVLYMVYLHLAYGGVFICSVANYPYTEDGHTYHATVRPFDWWWGFFEANGFERLPDLEAVFAPDKWVRHSNGTVNEFGHGSACFVLGKRGDRK